MEDSTISDICTKAWNHAQGNPAQRKQAVIKALRAAGVRTDETATRRLDDAAIGLEDGRFVHWRGAGGMPGTSGWEIIGTKRHRIGGLFKRLLGSGPPQ
jgi:hypothetical protein